METDGGNPPTQPPASTIIDLGGNGDYEKFLAGPNGVVDYDGTPIGGLFAGWPDEAGIEYALKVHAEQAAAADAEIQRMRSQAAHPAAGGHPEHVVPEADGPMRLVLELSEPWQNAILDAAVAWADHGCGGAVQVQADLAQAVADGIIRQLLADD